MLRVPSALAAAVLLGMACGRDPLLPLAVQPDPLGPGVDSSDGAAGARDSQSGREETGLDPLTQNRDAAVIDLGGASIGGSDARADTVGSDLPPPIARCMAPPAPVKPRRRATVSATVASPAGERLSMTWQLVAAPPSSRVALPPAMDREITFTPDVVGDYQLRFTVQDTRGRSSACVVSLLVRAQPPSVTCPTAASVRAGETLELSASASDDDGPVAYAWRVEVRPPGAEVSLEGSNTARVRFRADRGGTHGLALTVTDIDGATAQCRVPVRVLEPPRVTCPDPSSSVRNRSVSLAAEVSDDGRISGARWLLVERPAGSAAEPLPSEGKTTTLRPDRLGDYVLEFVAVDSDRLEARCSSRLTAIAEAPALTCPAIETRPLRDTMVAVTSSDNGAIVAWQWKLLATPAGSALHLNPPSERSFSFVPDLAGEYLFQLAVTDDEGLGAGCSLVVRAIAEEGLRAEMFWDTDGTDMDLHLLSPSATAWFGTGTAAQDCYFQTCLNDRPTWGAPSSLADDPHLDLDRTDGFGPENINLDRPAPGTYRIGVHALNGDANKVTVRIYCGGSTLEPRATLGPVALSEGKVWRAADVEVLASGGCEVRSLATGGGPSIISYGDATSAR